jgi:hypothetical protein
METPETVAAVRTVIVLWVVVTVLPGDLHPVAGAARRAPLVERACVDRVRHGASPCLCLVKDIIIYRYLDRPSSVASERLPILAEEILPGAPHGREQAQIDFHVRSE